MDRGKKIVSAAQPDRSGCPVRFDLHRRRGVPCRIGRIHIRTFVETTQEKERKNIMKKKLIAALTALLCISLLCVSSYAVLNEYDWIELWANDDDCLGTGYVNVPSPSAATAWTRVADEFHENLRSADDYIFAGFMAYTPSDLVWVADEANDEIEVDGMSISVVWKDGANWIEVSGAVTDASDIVYVNSYYGIYLDMEDYEAFDCIYEVYPGVPN